MHRRLAFLMLCCAATGCDGAGGDVGQGEPDDVGSEITSGPEPDAPVRAQVVAADEPTLKGIGDGELGGRTPVPGGGPTRDAGVAIRPVSPGVIGDGEVGGAGGFRPSPVPAPTPGGPRGGVSATGGRAASSDSSGGSAPVSSGSTGVRAPSPPRDPGLVAPRPLPPIVPPDRPLPGEPAPRPGTLTAGTWDDNRNFPFFERYRDALAQQLTGILPFSNDEFRRANEASRQVPGPRSKLDIALVIDTTGSMGDEIRYLQSEFIAISRAIQSAYPQSEQRWALVTYRDEGDEYTARYFDFRSDPQVFRDKLGAQSAGGGGDFPEAPQAAFAILNQFAWRTSRDVARLAFWVADAPHHPQYAGALAKSIRESRDLGIHVYPVASSGVDELTELSMRSAAQLTLGRYLFLTDDSRVGNDHKEPTIPCYFVTKLDDALLRMVSIEMTGVYREPDPQRILRVQGNPSRGSCSLGSGQTVLVF
jgi:hypothetical protein